MEKGYAAPIWMILRQAKKLAAHVRMGQGSLVVFANIWKKKEQGEEIEKEISFLKGYTDFNVEQIKSLPPPNYRQGWACYRHNFSNLAGFAAVYLTVC